MKYDEKPDYEKCRKYFSDGLKALGKSNSGELEFTASSSSTSTAKKSVAAAAAAISPLKEQRAKVGRPSTKVTGTAAAPKANGNTENVSPKLKSKSARKLDASSEDSASPSKKIRTTKSSSSSSSTQVRSSKTSTQSRSSKVTSTDSSIVVKNNMSEEKGKKHKTYNINLDLDISFDANVVVSVKRKKNKKPKEEVDEIVDSPNQSIQSTDEIPPSDKSFVVKTSKVYRRAQRSSPRSK